MESTFSIWGTSRQIICVLSEPRDQCEGKIGLRLNIEKSCGLMEICCSRSNASSVSGDIAGGEVGSGIPWISRVSPTPESLSG